MIKKFIRGNKDRGQEVIKALEDLGGVNKIAAKAKERKRIVQLKN